MISGIDHVQVAAPPGSEGAARGFYRDLLGLREIPKPPAQAARGGVWFDAGAQELHVGIEDPFVPARKAHPALAATDLAALTDRLAAAGHAITRDGPRCYVDDPFGNRLELVAPRATDLAIRPLRDDERAWATAFLSEFWGGATILFDDGREHRPGVLPALVAEAVGERAGLATYAIDGDACELVTLNALVSGRGVGGALVEAVAEAAAAAGATLLRVTTSNDNLVALRLYQRHGFAITSVHPGAVDRVRERKPSISTTAANGIPIRDEIDLERALSAPGPDSSAAA